MVVVLLHVQEPLLTLTVILVVWYKVKVVFHDWCHLLWECCFLITTATIDYITSNL